MSKLVRVRLDADKPFYLKITKNDITYLYKVRFSSIEMKSEFAELIYADNSSLVNAYPCTGLAMDFDVLPNDFVEKEDLES